MNSQLHGLTLIRALNEKRGYSSRVLLLPGCLLAIALSLAGCGGASEGPTVVSEDVKQQQVKELQEQRASEWGTAKKK